MTLDIDALTDDDLARLDAAVAAWPAPPPDIMAVISRAVVEIREQRAELHAARSLVSQLSEQFATREGFEAVCFERDDALRVCALSAQVLEERDAALARLATLECERGAAAMAIHQRDHAIAESIHRQEAETRAAKERDVARVEIARLRTALGEACDVLSAMSAPHEIPAEGMAWRALAAGRDRQVLSGPVPCPHCGTETGAMANDPDDKHAPDCGIKAYL